MKIKKINKINYNGDVYNLRIKSEDGLNHNYFANDLNVSNCHKAKSASIKTILSKCNNADYRFGLSGTIPKPGTLDRLTLMAYTGPVNTEVTANYLQNEGYIANCNVKIIKMDYAAQSTKEAFREMAFNKYESKDVFKFEQNYVINSPGRLNFISSVISRVPRNSLVLFHRIEHGKKIYDKLRQDSDKKVYYVDGGTDKDIREEYKKKMEAGGSERKEYTVLNFGDYELELPADTKMLLSDGMVKLAKDITKEDDIDDLLLEKLKKNI